MKSSDRPIPVIPWLALLPLIIGCARGADAVGSPGFRSMPLTVPERGRTGFTRLPEVETGVAVTNRLSDSLVAENQIRLIGSGVALGDVDGDGWCDIYVCGLEGDNTLWRNLGNWKFTNVTAGSGVACAGQFSTGTALADVDGDGDLDLLVNAIGGGTRLLLNDGQGRFGERLDSGLLRKHCATSLALADVDGDADPDLYVANYRTTTIRSTGLTVLNVGGRRVLRPEDRDQYEFTRDGLILEHGEPDQLYLNDGAGHFAPVSWTGGAFLDEDGRPLASAPKDWGLSAMFRDINGDGAPDLYVCNDFWSVDRVWINESRAGQVRFRAAPRLMLRSTSTFSMGVDFADINRDGFDDFIVLDMLSREHSRRMRQRSMLGQGAIDGPSIEQRPQVERNTLFLNRGDQTFAEIAQLSGVQASEWSWAVAFLDVDLDGFEDLLITTGHAFDTQDTDTEERLAARGPTDKVGGNVLQFPRLAVPNVAFRNRGDLTFEECGAKWGFDTPGVSHGMALGDLDNDGDLDVVVNNLNAPPGLYRNESAAPRVAIGLQGRAPNRSGIGARIALVGGPVTQTQEMICGGRYLSSDAAGRVFAAVPGVKRIEVTWRNGTRSVISNVEPNRVYEVEEAPTLTASRDRGLVRPVPLFREATNFQHLHRDESFDDFARQPLLSRQLSRLGPGVSWIDIDSDGHDDLVIAAGRGGALSILRNRGDGGFSPMRVGGALGRAADDQTMVVGWSPRPGVSSALVGQASYERTAEPLAGETARASVTTNALAAHHLEIAGGSMKMNEPVPGVASSTGPLALCDVDGDGDLDLFAGGRVVPGRYPEPATSRMFRNDGGRFTLAAEWKELALVSGAAFSDLDGDGFAELILACDWGPLKIFRNDNGRLVEWDPPVRLSVAHSVPLSSLGGWWTAVTAGDFDGDGQLDIVAANWGRNTPYQEFVKDGWRVFYGDLAGHGSIEMVEAFQEPALRRLVPWRDRDSLSRVMPWLRERFTSHAAYGVASLQEVLGDLRDKAREWRVTWTDSTLFLNRRDHFVARSLLVEAQFAPAFGLCVGDADGDGAEDLFLAQNFSAVDGQTSRFDAGRGLWLRGDGAGGFRPLSGNESGVILHGEQRGAALCDYDGDGRLDLAVSQNNAATRLFHNELARPGLRVRLAGPVGNGTGLGAVMRVIAAGGLGVGPAREIRGGAGYWSQDSAVTVLSLPAAGEKLSVRWPGGRRTEHDVPGGALEVRLDFSGAVK